MFGLYAVIQRYQPVYSLCYWTLIFVTRGHSIPEQIEMKSTDGRRYFLLLCVKLRASYLKCWWIEDRQRCLEMRRSEAAVWVFITWRSTVSGHVQCDDSANWIHHMVAKQDQERNVLKCIQKKRCCSHYSISPLPLSVCLILGLIQFPSDRLLHTDAVSITTRSQTQAFIN